MRLRAAMTLAVLTGCFGMGHVASPVEQRAAAMKVDLARLPPTSRAAIERGDVWVGATEVEAFIARAEPKLWWNTWTGRAWCRVLVQANAADPTISDVAITTCGGVVVAVTPIAPRLPCWRLASIGPRILASSELFDRLPIQRQWQLVAGILERGQTSEEVDLAFGQPYNRGFEEREDGRRADQLVFLDHGGNAYGLAITLIAGKVAGWKMPAERRLTPEAEQRRLDAMERRLTSQIAALEELTRRQHEETVKLFGEVMDKQESMLAALAAPILAEAAAEAGAQIGAAVGAAIPAVPTEETAESSVTESASGTATIKHDGPTTTINVDESSHKETKSKRVRKPKR